MAENMQQPQSSESLSNGVSGNGRRTGSTRSNLPGISLRHGFQILWKFRHRSLSFFVATMLLVVIGLIVCPRKYTSEAKLFVRLGRESVTLDPTVTTGQVMGVEVSREAEINSLLQVISTRNVLETVVDKMKLDARYTGPLARDRAIIALQKGLSIWSPKKSNVIGVKYKSKSPEQSQQVVRAIIDTFLNEHRRANSTVGSYEFFAEQAAGIKLQLDAEIAKLRDTKNTFHIGSIEGRRQSLQKQIDINEQQVIDTQTELYALRAKMAELGKRLETLPSPVVKQFVKGLPAAGAEDNMREQLYALQLQEQKLLSSLTASHPFVIAIRQQVRESERILDSEQPDHTQATSAVLLTDTASEKSLEAKLTLLKHISENLQQELSTFNRQEVEIVEIERQVQLLEAKYTTYTHNLEQARIGRELKKDEITNISVIQPASLVLKPSSPRKAFTLVLGCIFGIAAAIALAFVSENLEQTSASSRPNGHAVRSPVATSIRRLQPNPVANGSI